MDNVKSELEYCYLSAENLEDFSAALERARKNCIPNSFSQIRNYVEDLYRMICIELDTRYAEELCKFLDPNDIDMADMMTDMITWNFPNYYPRDDRDREKMRIINVFVSYLENIRTSQKVKTQLERFRRSLNYESIKRLGTL